MRKSLRKSLKEKDGFIVIAETSGGSNFSSAPVERFLDGFNRHGKEVIPYGYNFVGISVPQNPGGMANLEPVDVLARI
ncbi:MAG: hypothetical protein WCZ89_08000, partial [Phycisphaerae bacterium]